MMHVDFRQAVNFRALGESPATRARFTVTFGVLDAPGRLADPATMRAM
jgi:hypothetical protein